MYMERHLRVRTRIVSVMWTRSLPTYGALELTRSKGIKNWSRPREQGKVIYSCMRTHPDGTSSHDATKVCDTMFGTSVGMKSMGSWALKGECVIFLE